MKTKVTYRYTITNPADGSEMVAQYAKPDLALDILTSNLDRSIACHNFLGREFRDEDGHVHCVRAIEIVKTQYLATIRHHSISRARQIRIPGTLTQAMNEAATEFGDEQRDYEIAIYEDMGDERMPKLVATRLVSGTEWRER